MTEDPKELVARLRGSSGCWGPTALGTLLNEAADLIDRLTADREGSVPEDVVERVARAIAIAIGRGHDPDKSIINPFAGGSVTAWEMCRRDAASAIAATPPPEKVGNANLSVLKGFVLVPVVPTEAMLEASWQATRITSPEDRIQAELMSPAASHKHKARNRYRAMIAAAPAPALPETGVGNTSLEDRHG